MDKKELKAHLRLLHDDFCLFQDGKMSFSKLLENIIDELERLGVLKGD